MSSFVVMVDFRIKPGKLDQFRKLVIENARTSVRDERGCRQFDVVEPAGELGRIFLYEIYDTAAGFEIHKQSAHFLDFDKASTPLVLSKAITLGALTFAGRGD